jgi:hypothetical protein
LAGLELRLFGEVGASGMLKQGEAGALKPDVLCCRVGDEFGHADQIDVISNTPLEKAIPIATGADAEKLDQGRAC